MLTELQRDSDVRALVRQQVPRPGLAQQALEARFVGPIPRQEGMPLQAPLRHHERHALRDLAGVLEIHPAARRARRRDDAIAKRAVDLFELAQRYGRRQECEVCALVEIAPAVTPVALQLEALRHPTLRATQGRARAGKALTAEPRIELPRQRASKPAPIAHGETL